MAALYVTLNSIDAVKDFVNNMDSIEGRAMLSDHRCTIDAKSIIGILSLNLAKPLRLEIENWKEEYTVLLKRYLVR